MLGPSAQIGRTCHDSRHLAMEAGEAGADYVAFGAFYPTTTKPSDTGRSRDPELVGVAVRNPVRRDRRDHAGQCGAAGRGRRGFHRGVPGGVGRGRSGARVAKFTSCSRANRTLDKQSRVGPTFLVKNSVRRHFIVPPAYPRSPRARSLVAFTRPHSQPARSPSQSDKPTKPWVPPGTPGSPIDGTVFHAQVLLDAAGFSPGSSTARRACRSRRRSRVSRNRAGCRSPASSTCRRAALLQAEPAIDHHCELGPAMSVARSSIRSRRSPRTRPSSTSSAIATCSRRSPRGFTHAGHDRRAERPRQLIGAGQTLRLPNVVPAGATMAAPLQAERRAWFAC